MANKNYINGASFVTNRFGGPSTGKVNLYTVAAADGTALYVGDFVKLTGESDKGDDGFYHPTITQAAASDLLVGWVISFIPNPNYLNQLHRTASTLRTAVVIDDPDAHFIIQSTGTGASGDIGQCADITVGAGNAFSGLSGMQLDHGTLGGGSGQLRIVQLPLGEYEFGAYTKFVCFINEHAYKGTVGV